MLFKINLWFVIENLLGFGVIVLGKIKEFFGFFLKKEGKKFLMEYIMYIMNDIILF